MLISLVPGFIRCWLKPMAVARRCRRSWFTTRPEVGQLHADDDVGIGDRGRSGAEMMRLREVHPLADVDDAGLQRLGKLHEQPHAVLGARRAARPRSPDSAPRRGAWRLPSPRPSRRPAARSACISGCRASRRCGPDRLLLQAGVERDHDRAVGRGHRDLVGAHDRLREVLQRHRRVVPLGEVANQRVDVLRRVDGRHARRPDARRRGRCRRRRSPARGRTRRCRSPSRRAAGRPCRGTASSAACR